MSLLPGYTTQVPQTYTQRGLPAAQVVDIPEGLTLAGLSGRAGDSWDQVTLHVCPFLPGGGQWNRGLHAHYPQPFKEQVRVTWAPCAAGAASLAPVHAYPAVALPVRQRQVLSTL